MVLKAIRSAVDRLCHERPQKTATDGYVKEKCFPLYQRRFLLGCHEQIDDQPDKQLLVGREIVGRQQDQGGQRGIADQKGHAFTLQIDQKGADLTC